VQIPVTSDDELGALAKSFNVMSRQILEADKTAELQAAHERDAVDGKHA
jgi:nitrogen fixation/metabolism regulation signal transduction histidine kinase